ALCVPKKVNRRYFIMSSNDEPKFSQFIHVVFPTVIVIILSSISLYSDISTEDGYFWFQRSGALMGAAGIYIGFHEGNWKMTTRNQNLYINTQIWYQWLALALGVLGTLIWAYGDLPFK
ncbi:hypothetical protein, partial [Vibrio parahaemolyticus]|uniref:hypothetical protein n=1 Tax=Vibrio parahaemolyticus TaxID=670 RepID=UPI001E3F7FF0